MERKYSALRFVAVLMKVIGAISIIVGILGLISAIRYFATTHDYNTIGPSVIWTVGPILSGIFWWALAEIIYVFIDIEYNTRRLSLVERRVVPDVAAD
jgi:hypothetical protein